MACPTFATAGLLRSRQRQERMGEGRVRDGGNAFDRYFVDNTGLAGVG